MHEPIQGHSTSSLVMMHDGVLKSLSIDDQLPSSASKIYGVRESREWRRLADAIEQELQRREVDVAKIPW